MQITYIEQQGGPLGLAHIVKNAKSFIGEEEFLFYLGDNIILSELNEFVDKFKNSDLNCLLALSKVKDPQRFGVPVIENGKIIRVEEKPQEPKTDFAVTGIYLYDKNIFEAVENIEPSERGEYEISDAHTYLINKGLNVGYQEITGWWKDTGKPQDLLEGNQLLLNFIEPKNEAEEIEETVVIQGKVQIGKGTKILGNSLLRGPLSIGENCTITDAYIAPYTSVGNKTEISSTEIEHSIVLENVDINCSTRIVDSIIGYNATIYPAKQTFPSGHRLIVGDNSVIEL